VRTERQVTVLLMWAHNLHRSNVLFSFVPIQWCLSYIHALILNRSDQRRDPRLRRSCSAIVPRDARHRLERNLELSSWIMRVPLNYLYYVICPCCQLRDGVTRRL
jgi:hypothetical protein